MILKVKIFYLIILLICSTSCEEKLFVNCSEGFTSFCIYGKDSTNFDLKLGEVQSIFLQNKEKFLNDNDDWVWFEIDRPFQVNFFKQEYNCDFEIIVIELEPKLPDGRIPSSDDLVFCEKYLESLCVDFNAFMENEFILSITVTNIYLPRKIKKNNNFPPPDFPPFHDKDLYFLNNNFNFW